MIRKTIYTARTQDVLSNGVKAIDARFEIRRSKPGMGQGLFAATRIKKGEFILEYTGKKISTAVADTMEKARYLFEIDKNWTIDGSSRSNTARYINHSCDPNTEAGIENGYIMIHAVRNIKKGEELTIDYDTEYFDEFIRPVGCKCVKCSLQLGVES
ncbi:MAG: SET domain-containing protein [bacterium]|nr:SET domain-containing protein [bacterium]